MTAHIRLMLVTGGAVAALLLLPTAAAAQEASLRVDPSTVAPGDEISVSGHCPQGAGEPVTLVLGGDVEGGQLDEVTADEQGAFETTVTIPADAPTGSATVLASCGSGADPRASLTITETGDAAGGSTSEGSDEVPPLEGPTLGPGAAGVEVRQWQEALNVWLAEINAETIAEDGVFGPRTEFATRLLQEQADIPVDGIVGEDTRRALARLTAASPELPGGSEIADGPVLGQGEAGDEVRAWQEALNVWLRAIDAALLDVDGVFGPRTEFATRLFQQRSDITVDGIVGPATRDALDDALAG